MQDIKSCKDGEWFNDEVVNSYTSFVQKACNLNYSPGDRKTIITTSFWYTRKVAQSGNEALAFREICKKCGLTNRQTKTANRIDLSKTLGRIIVPINIDHQHWMVGLIDFVNQNVKIYDSERKLERGAGHGAAKFADRLLHYANWMTYDNETEDWEICYPTFKSAAYQEDGFQCGVHACYFVNNLSQLIDEMEINPLNIQRLRKTVVLIFAREAINSRNWVVGQPIAYERILLPASSGDEDMIISDEGAGFSEDEEFPKANKVAEANVGPANPYRKSCTDNVSRADRTANLLG
jgi:Ulp1 family protease